jgi:RsiW-degrading membrane proteinase PrsW (M82 family)
MGVIVSFIIGFGSALLFACILYWLDRFEKEPLLLLGAVFLWGAVVAAGSAFVINTVLGIGIFAFTGSEVAYQLTTGSIVAPLVEETLKGAAVLIVFLVFRREFDSVLDGIIYAGVAALGFVATENTYYIYAYGYQEGGWSGLFYLTFVRVFLVGWQHPFYTAFFGIGLAMARLNRNMAVKILAPLFGLGLAMFTHRNRDRRAGTWFHHRLDRLVVHGLRHHLGNLEGEAERGTVSFSGSSGGYPYCWSPAHCLVRLVADVRPHRQPVHR